MDKLVRIAIAGEGGQGVQSIADILAEAGNEEGKEALYIPNFGIEQRGGVSLAYVQIGDKLIGSPKFEEGDVVVALSERAVKRIISYVGSNTIFVYDNSLIVIPEVTEEIENMPSYQAMDTNKEKELFREKINNSIHIQKTAATVTGVPATDLAKRELHPRVFNVIVLGAVIEAAKIVSEESVKRAMENNLGRKFEKDPALRELNHKALHKGIEIIRKALVRS